jgi:uncharacterized protein (UPF0333 family)
MGKRAQASMEYLMIAGFLLVVVGIAFLYSQSSLSNSVDDAKAKTAVNTLAKAIDQVYALGPGSKLTVTLDLPTGISSQIVEDNLVGYITTVNGNPAHYYADTKAKLYGILPTTGGPQTVTLQVNDSGQVYVGETNFGIAITPLAINVNLDINQTLNQKYLFTIQNLNSTPISGVSLSVDPTSSIYSYVTSIGSVPSTLSANQSVDFNVTLVFPGSATPQVYSGYLNADSNNGNAKALLQIVVNQTTTPQKCTGTGTCTDTNWQTSWSIFDLNMKTEYQLINENILHWHDSRYYTKTQSDVNWNKYTLINADINWVQLQNYPTACPSGYAINDMNDTNFNCIPVGGNDTNWQTSWPLLDANLRTTYTTIIQTRAANFFDDFDGSTVGMGWTAVNSGTSAAEALVDVVAGENTMGVLQWFTGTTATGRAALVRNTGATALGQGKFDITLRAKVPTLSVVAQEFSVQLGLHDATTKDAVDGVYFHYDRLGYGSDVIRCVTSSASTRTTNSSGVTMNTSWNKYHIKINPAGTQALFYINNNLVCTHTTNMPTAVTSPRIQIVKSAGTTARTLLVDYWQQDLNFTVAR